MNWGDDTRGLELVEDSGDDWLLSEDPVYSTYEANLVGLDSCLVRMGDNFRGEGGGLRVVARTLGNCVGVSDFCSLVGGASFFSRTGLCGFSDLPGSN